MKTRTVAFVGVLACSTLIVGAQQLSAQRAQLTRIGSGLAGGGFYETHERQTGSLREDQSTTFSVWLDQGVEYIFRGTCDRDCSDLDLELQNSQGVVIDSDFAPDDVPAVGVRPRRSGWYRVRAIMAACSIEPCGFAVGTFGR